MLIHETSDARFSYMGLSLEQSERVHYCDFTYMVAVLVPNVPREKLRIAADWGNWVSLPVPWRCS